MAGHTAQVACLAFSPDGKMLASGSHDGSVKVWDPASGQELRTHRGSQAQAWMQQVAFSRDGKLFAFSGYTQSTALCEAKTGNVRHQLEGFTSALAFAPDSKTLATARQKIVLYDVDTGQQKLSLERHGSEIKCLAFSPDGRILASASDDGSVRLSDAANGAEKLVIIDSAPFRSLGFSSDGTRLWFGAGSRIKVLDSTTGQTALVLGGDARDYLSATAATPDGGLLAGAWGRAIPVWDLRPRRRR
jgi:WD40 repeat protein